jgi:hypothetical protein
MEKVLVIRKPDRTIHKVSLANKAALMAYNNLQPDSLKWTFEEMDEDKADKLPFIDDNYIASADAHTKAKELAVTVSEKDAKIAELEALLATKSSEAKSVKK